VLHRWECDGWDTSEFEIVERVVFGSGLGYGVLSDVACYGLGLRYCFWNGLFVRSAMVGEGRY